MDYSFNVDLAEQYGVEEAVFLQHLYFWIQKNAVNGKHFHDGMYWTYNSAQAFTAIFPFWSRQKIEYVASDLTLATARLDSSDGEVRHPRRKD